MDSRLSLLLFTIFTLILHSASIPVEDATENQDAEYLTEDTGLYPIAVRIETFPVVFFLHLEDYLDELTTALNQTVTVLRSDGIDQIFAVVNGVYTPITKDSVFNSASKIEMLIGVNPAACNGSCYRDEIRICEIIYRSRETFHTFEVFGNREENTPYRPVLLLPQPSPPLDSSSISPSVIIASVIALIFLMMAIAIILLLSQRFLTPKQPLNPTVPTAPQDEVFEARRERIVSFNV